MEFTNNIQFINREMFINDLEREMIINDRERELNAAIINSYILAVPEREEPVAEEPASEEPAPEVTREVDQCVYQLCSKQDRVYTKQENLDEDTEIWNMALWDGHGSTKGRIDPKTWRPTKVNFMLDCLDEMIANGEIDGILQKDIFSEEDPALALQRALGRKCVEHKQTMASVGATMILVKVKHIISRKKIIVEVLSSGDSSVMIFCNGEKVLENVCHDGFNEQEIARLITENRVYHSSPTEPGASFEILDELHVCAKEGKYIVAKNGDKLATSQSVGHLEYFGGDGGKVLDERGVYGIAPYKAQMEFSDTDEVNIKLFSDGISDMISTEKIKSDAQLIQVSNATELANVAKTRWEGKWQACSKVAYLKSLEDPTVALKTNEHCFNKVDKNGNSGTDDISCISWIQSKRV